MHTLILNNPNLPNLPSCLPPSISKQTSVLPWPISSEDCDVLKPSLSLSQLAMIPPHRWPKDIQRIAMFPLITSCSILDKIVENGELAKPTKWEKKRTGMPLERQELSTNLLNIYYPPDVFPRVCFHYFSSTHLEWVHFFCGFYNVFLVPCIVLVSEMLSFTMVTKFNYFLIWKLHRFVLCEVVSKASRGSLLQPWFIPFLVFFQSNVFRKRVFIECSECIHRSTLFLLAYYRFGHV